MIENKKPAAGWKSGATVWALAAHRSGPNFKGYYNKILDAHFFYIFVHQEVFPGHLANFQSISNIATHVFWTFIP